MNVAARRDVDRRPAADAPGPGRPVHRAPARPAGGQARDHRLGAGQRAHLAALARADRARPLVRRAPVAARSTCGSCAGRCGCCVRGHGLYKGETGGWQRTDAVAVLLTGVGKRYDIVSAFAQHATVVAADPNPLAPAQYAADVRRAVPRIDDPGYVPGAPGAVRRVRRRRGRAADRPRHRGPRATRARPAGCRAFVPDRRDRRAPRSTSTRRHLLLERLGLPSPPTVLPGEPVDVLPGDGQAAPGLGRALDPPAPTTRAGGEFFADYIDEPVMVQRLMDGPGVLDRLPVAISTGRCLNAIPRTMLESRGGESIKGTVIARRRS